MPFSCPFSVERWRPPDRTDPSLFTTHQHNFEVYLHFALWVRWYLTFKIWIRCSHLRWDFMNFWHENEPSCVSWLSILCVWHMAQHKTSMGARRIINVIMPNDAQKILRFHIVAHEMQKTALLGFAYGRLAQRKGKRDQFALCRKIAYISCTYE